MLQRRAWCGVTSGLARRGVATAATDDSVFERYSEIENSTISRIDAITAAGMANDEWIATEKVHGANFGLYSLAYGSTLRFAKRSGLMPPHEHFFGYHILLPQLTQYARTIRELVHAHLHGRKPHTVIVNGELFGGKYDHPSLSVQRRRPATVMVCGRSRSVSAVQTNAFPQYSPDLHFYAFDIKYKIDDAATSPCVTLTYDDATRIFAQVPDLLYARALVRGTLATVTALDVEHLETTLPPLLGMGNYPLKNNWAEGVVVRHARRGDAVFDARATAPTMLKLKCTAFQEISTDRAQGPRVDAMAAVRQSSLHVAGAQLPALESVVRDAALLAATRHLLAHVCENRLTSVLSKLGSAPFETRALDANALATLLARDALRDFLAEADAAVVNAPLLTRRDMTRYAVFEARRLVCSKWAQILQRQREIAGDNDDDNGGCSGDDDHTSGETGASSATAAC